MPGPGFTALAIKPLVCRRALGGAGGAGRAALLAAGGCLE